jgi:hypothetical protein
MPEKYLHNQKDFPYLLRILEDESGVLLGLIEKDYWIVHVLFGLRKQNFNFELYYLQICVFSVICQYGVPYLQETDNLQL